MAETANIAAAAVLVSEELFSVLGWEPVGPPDTNFPCIYPEKHKCKTHPTDVVFQYEDIYSDRIVCVLTDLKSYGAKTVSSTKVGGALADLALSVECAQVSQEWRTTYAQTVSHPPEIVGMLFIYNHDREFTSDFRKLIGQADDRQLAAPLGTRNFVLGPDEVRYAASLARDLRTMQTKLRIKPDDDRTGFFYPQLIRAKARRSFSPVATIETILAPFQTYVCQSKAKSHCIIYSRQMGDSQDEFLYLLDYLFHFQLIEQMASVELRFFQSDKSARSNFDAAKKRFVLGLPSTSGVQKMMERITLGFPPEIVERILQEELGMNRRG